MNKFGTIIVIVFLIAILYVTLTLVMPTVADMANTANTSMAATSNMTDYPGVSEAMVFGPWFLYLSPAVIGLIAVFVILRG